MSPNRQPRNVSASLDVLRFPTAVKNFDRSYCLHCSSFLTLYQPDLALPERLIGVCEHCRHWFLIDLLIDVSEAVLTRLPDVEVVREISRENQSAGISLQSHEPDSEPPDLQSPLP